MAFINKTQKIAFSFRPFCPQFALRAISTGIPTRVPSFAPMTSFKGTVPYNLSNLSSRESKTQFSSTITVRPYSESYSKTEEVSHLKKLLSAAPLITTTLTKHVLNIQVEKTILNLLAELHYDIKDDYPNITIDEIRTTLSADCFGKDLTAFAAHLVEFFESIDRSNAAFPDRKPVTVSKAFTAYKEEREYVLRHQQEYSIYFSSANLTTLPAEIRLCTKAENFTLFWTRLTSLPDFLGDLQNIEKVEISGNHFQTFPECLTKLTNMTRLMYTHNSTERLPDTFCNLTNLERLNLEKNAITALPENFGALSLLWQIDLEHNKLKTLPDSFGKLLDLKECYLLNNQIESLPETISGLKSLTLLQLSDNRLTVLPRAFSFLPSLEYLYLERNQLTEFPAILPELQNLTVLILNDNKLQSLPLVLGVLPKLYQLSVANNQLTEFPAVIAGSESITGLDLSGNQLTEFNHRMKNLKVLLLTKNKITKLPRIEKLPKLEILSVVKNPIKNLPKNLVGLDGQSHALNNRMQIGWAGAIMQAIKVPNRPTPTITVFEETRINDHNFFLVIEDNHPCFNE